MAAVGQGSRREQGDEGRRPKERHDVVEEKGVSELESPTLKSRGEKRKAWEGRPNPEDPITRRSTLFNTVYVYTVD